MSLRYNLDLFLKEINLVQKPFGLIQYLFTGLKIITITWE